MNGSQFFGRSGGSLAAMASSGQSGAVGGPSCGSAGAGTSPLICANPGQPLPSVTSQPYVPSANDVFPAPACKIRHV